MTPDRNEHSAALAARVRQNAGSSAIAAALMIYFGFFHGYITPKGSDLFSLANLVFLQTIRIGGIAMAALAVWSLIGAGLALIVDAIVSFAVGGLLALTGIAMFLDGGGVFQSALNVMFGWMFVSVGRRNWRDYFLLTKLSNDAVGLAAPLGRTSRAGDVLPSPGEREPRFQHPVPEPTNEPLPSRPAPVDSPPSVLDSDPAPPPDSAGAEVNPSQSDRAIRSESDDEPGGFLASFADEGPPPAP